MAGGTKQINDSGLNFEAQLRTAADQMRGHTDASEHKHACLAFRGIGANLSANSYDKNVANPRPLLLH